MKKLLLISIVALLCATSVYAKQLSFSPASVRHNAPARVDEAQTLINYCQGFAGGIGFGEEGHVQAAIEVPAGKASALKGGKLTTVNVGLGSCTAKQITLFLTKDLFAEPFYTETVDIVSNNGWNAFTLKNPYEIDGERFYIGYGIDGAALDSPIGVDGKTAVTFGDYIAFEGQWGHMSSFGLNYNVSITAMVEGVAAPDLIVDVSTVSVSKPTVKTNSGFHVTSSIYNVGNTPIDSVEAVYQFGTMAPVIKTHNFTNPVAVYASTSFVYVNATIDYEALDIPVTVTITKINGVDVAAQTSASTSINVWNTPLVSLDGAVTSVTTVKPGTEFTVTTTILNNGADKVKKVEAVYEIADQAPVTQTHTIFGGVSTTKTSTFKNASAVCMTEGLNVPIKVTVTKVDDVEITPVSVTTYIDVSNTTFDRTVVVEEGTGTWCGYCPRGIVGMEYMNLTYPDSFIGIAVHMGDEMQVGSYAYYYPAAGFPTSNIDRRFFGVDPSKANLENYYNVQRNNNPAIAKVEVKDVAVNEVDRTAAVTTDVTFVLDGVNVDDNYCLSYVVMEHNVGPYMQTNYYAGNALGAMAGWETKEKTVSTMYNDVARDIIDYNGVAGTIPAAIEANTPSKHTQTISLANVEDLKNLSIAVLLLNEKTGMILNADKWPAGYAGVDDVIVDAENSVKITTGFGVINIAGDYNAAYVYGIDGKLISSATEGSIAVPSGMYVVKVISGAEAVVQKVLVP